MLSVSLYSIISQKRRKSHAWLEEEKGDVNMCNLQEAFMQKQHLHAMPYASKHDRRLIVSHTHVSPSGEE